MAPSAPVCPRRVRFPALDEKKRLIDVLAGELFQAGHETRNLSDFYVSVERKN